MADENFEPTEKMARLAEADMARAIDAAAQVDRIFAGVFPASNVVALPNIKIDDDDRHYMAEQFDEVVDLIERLPRTYRVFMRREMTTQDKASLVEIAGLLAAMGAKVAPQPKDAA